MFDSEFGAASDAEVVAAIEDGVRQEAIAVTRRLSAIAELTRRRHAPDDPRDLWVFDPWDCTAAEVAAAMAIGQRKASGQMRIAQALCDRLPKVAGLFWKGALSARLVSAITWGTHLLTDDAAVASVDAAIAERATTWERLSEDKLREVVNDQVARVDADAVRATHQRLRGRDFTVGSYDEEDAEIVHVWGQLQAHHGEVLKQRIAVMVAGVCDKDPRSMGERRSDAVGAIANGNDTLTCLCGSASCPATGGDTPQSKVAVHLVGDQAAVDDAIAALNAARKANGAEVVASLPAVHAAEAAAPARALTDDTATAPVDVGDVTASAAVDDPAPVPSESPAPQPKPQPKKKLPAPALLLGRGIVPNALLADAIRACATITPIRTPSAEPEKHYRPSARLAQWVRMRDLWCRFPGCTVSAHRCDIDHTRPWPFGPTHPSNLSCRCRGHHLMKTFYTGPGGWTDIQLPDGTVVFTAPSGAIYRTHPGSRLLFPDWDVTTADLPPPAEQPPPLTAGRGLRMPRRQQSRAVALAAAIQAERELNARDIAPF